MKWYSVGQMQSKPRWKAKPGRLRLYLI